MRESPQRGVRHSLAEWRMICERFAHSGFEVVEFCSREQSTVSNFKKWYRRCRREEPQGWPGAQTCRRYPCASELGYNPVANAR
jgi:hypothetical protein